MDPSTITLVISAGSVSVTANVAMSEEDAASGKKAATLTYAQSSPWNTRTQERARTPRHAPPCPYVHVLDPTPTVC